MRYLFFILITYISFGQSKPKDLTEVHIYNIINTFDIGHDQFREINFFEDSYLKEDNFLLLKTTDEKAVKKIYKSINQIKNYSKINKSSYTHFGNENFKTMFVIKYNSYLDTLFYSINTNEIYYKNNIVKDEKEAFKKSLSNEIIHFINKDVISELKRIEDITNSHLKTNQILINNINIHGFNRKQFEKKIAPINFIVTDSSTIGSELKISKDFYINLNKVTFDSENETFGLLNLKNQQLKLKIDGIEIKIGNSINVLKDKFNSSYEKWLKLNTFYNKRKNELSFFEIDVLDVEGKITFLILNSKIHEIYVDYN